VTAQRILTRVVVALLLVQALVPGASAGGQEAATSPIAEASTPVSPLTEATAPVAWLRGPFGRVAGGTFEDPATAPPGGQPLGTVVQRAPLVLETASGEAISALVVTAQPIDVPRAPEPLSNGDLAFEGPDAVGRSLIVAHLTTASGVAARLAWLVDVPDQEPPEDGLYDIPAPEIVVTASGGSSSGRSGSGCYAYLCVDVGNPPPVEDLPVLAVRPGEPLAARPDDGSALVSWKGRLSSLDDPSRVPVRTGAALQEPLQNVVNLAGLEPPAAGRWLLDLEVEFDRERGWMRTLYVLDVR
jgi:hypothetical protein